MSNYFRNFDQKEEYASPKEREFSRILTAAVVNVNFRNLLLSNPGLAIRNGYNGEAFHLGKDEAERLSAIRAASLAEFAKQMNQLSA
jgi:hypothetical protein